MEVEFNAAMQLLINQLHAHIAGGARGMDQLLQAVRLRDLASVQVLVPAHIDAAALNIPDNQTVRDRFPNVRTPIWYSGFSDYADLTVLQYAVLFTITSDSADDMRIIEHLIQHGADPDQQNPAGLDARTVATSGRCDAIRAFFERFDRARPLVQEVVKMKAVDDALFCANKVRLLCDSKPQRATRLETAGRMCCVDVVMNCPMFARHILNIAWSVDLQHSLSYRFRLRSGLESGEFDDGLIAACAHGSECSGLVEYIEERE